MSSRRGRIDREAARLRAAFRSVLLASVALPAAAQACSSTASSESGGVVDASAGATEAGDDATPGAAGDSGDAAAGAVDAALLDDATGDASGDALDDAPSPLDAWTNLGEACAPGPVVIVDRCSYTRVLPCGHAPVADGGCERGLECTEVCTSAGGGQGVFGCAITGIAGCGLDPDAGDVDATVTIVCDTCPGVGRRPQGLAKPARPRRPLDAAGAYLARAAHLENASVEAFEALREELVHVGAPRDLVRAADAARRDEIRHGRVVAALARSRGALPPPVAVRPRRRATLEGLARENAVEGCVRESFGALVARIQAERAAAPDVRRAMARIARDEETHAALSWALAAWLEPRLTRGERQRVDRARRRAVAVLSRELRSDVGARVSSELGLPRPREMARLLGALDAHLFGA